MQGRLNSFQRSMLQWNDMQPYNAIHVIRLPGAPDLERLRSVIDGTLEKLGLTHLAINQERATFSYQWGATRSEITVITPEALETEMTRQLNTPFAAEKSVDPFRFFVTQEVDGFLLGLVYFHPVADAESIIFLLKRMVDVYAGRNPSTNDRLQLYPARFDHLLRSPGLLVRKIASLPSLIHELRTAFRLPCRNTNAAVNGFSFFSLPPDALSTLIATSKAWDVTVNDLFLALLLKSLSFMSPYRTRSTRRRKIPVGCIVNLRKNLPLDSPRTFGLFVGSFLVSHEVPDAISLKDLAHDVRQQTGPIKKHKLYLTSALETGFARWLASFSSTEPRKKFYQKNYPLWGGITNMNLNSLWNDADRERPLDYFRTVSTGPVTALVLSITTVRDVINIGVSYRSSVFSRSQMERVKAEFLTSLNQLLPPI